MTELDMLGHTDPYKIALDRTLSPALPLPHLRPRTDGPGIQAWTDHFIPAGRRVHRKLRRLDGAAGGSNWAR